MTCVYILTGLYNIGLSKVLNFSRWMLGHETQDILQLINQCHNVLRNESWMAAHQHLSVIDGTRMLDDIKDGGLQQMSY